MILKDLKTTIKNTSLNIRMFRSGFKLMVQQNKCTSRCMQCSLLYSKASSPNGSPSDIKFPCGVNDLTLGHEIPASKNVTWHVSFGKYNRNLDPLATYSTMADDRPARCKNGKNWEAFARSYKIVSKIICYSDAEDYTN